MNIYVWGKYTYIEGGLEENPKKIKIEEHSDNRVYLNSTHMSTQVIEIVFGFYAHVHTEQIPQNYLYAHVHTDYQGF